MRRSEKQQRLLRRTCVWSEKRILNCCKQVAVSEFRGIYLSAPEETFRHYHNGLQPRCDEQAVIFIIRIIIKRP
jgi:hypothetical protein